MTQKIPCKAEYPSEIDLLNISEYIDSVATYLEKAITPITISIQGGWGEGKTTFVHNVKDKMSKKNHWIEINTWQLSLISDQALFPLLIMNKIINDLNGTKDVDGILSLIASITSPIISKFASDKLNTDIQVDLADIKNIFTTHDLYEQTDKLKKSFDDTVTKFLEKNKHIEKIIIFIDDLDRLDPRIALDLLEKLNNFFRSRNCVFILAVDEDVINNGVKDKFNGSDNLERLQKQFFEKIIQLPFNLPINAYDTKELINEFIGKPCVDYDSIFYQIFQDKNPRNIKRVLNLFELYKTIIEKTSKGKLDESELKILLSLMCIQVNEKEDYFEIVSAEESEIIDTINSVSPKLIKLLNLSKKDEKKIYKITSCLSKNIGVDSNKPTILYNAINNYLKKEWDKTSNNEIDDQTAGKVFYRQIVNDKKDLYITVSYNLNNTTKILLYPHQKVSLYYRNNKADDAQKEKLFNLYNAIVELGESDESIRITGPNPILDKHFYKIDNIPDEVNYDLLYDVFIAYFDYLKN